MLMDNGWYRMLRNPKVTLVDEHVARVDSDGYMQMMEPEYDADVLVIATGFDVLNFITTYEAKDVQGVPWRISGNMTMRRRTWVQSSRTFRISSPSTDRIFNRDMAEV